MPEKFASKTFVERWLRVELAPKLPPSMPDRDLKIAIQHVAGQVHTKYPPEAFTPVSARAIAEGLDGFPSLEVFADRLAAWWADHRPGSDAALPGGDNPNLSREDRLILANFERDRDDGFSRINAPSFRAKLAIRLSTYRRHYPALFRHIVRTDLEAAAIAVQYGWTEDAETAHYSPDKRTDEERARASVTVAEAIQAMAQQRRPTATFPADRPGVGRKLDEAVQQVKEAAAAFERVRGRKPGELSPEQLAEARARAGIKTPPPRPPNVVPLRPRPVDDPPPVGDPEPTFEAGSDGELLWTPPWMTAAE